VLLLAALTGLFFYRLIFTDWILARGDTLAYFYPYWQARSAAFMAGRLPLWSPHLFMGVPLLANSQLGTFYPPNWIVAPLSAPDAVRASIVVHGFWLSLGTYRLARGALGLGRFPALIAAAVFAFGGYIGGRVEQINQIQGLAWMPWLFWLTHRLGMTPGRSAPLLALALALQFFTGHTQTVFISAAGIGLYALMLPGRARRIPWLAAAGAAGLILAAPQLVPTLELTGVSNRSGGLNQNEATAFSFNPFLAARGLLPSYDRSQFAEYIAYPGIIAVGLALLGGLLRAPGSSSAAPTARLRSFLTDARLPWIVLGVVGLAFAFGQYNPLYWLLAGLPGFNLFRVPARWLVLFALAVALLAGFGVQALSQRNGRVGAPALALCILLIGALAGGTLLTARNPEPVESYPPALISYAGWAAAALILFGVLWLAGRPHMKAAVPGLALGAVIIELFAASRALPYNRLVPPQTFSSQRFTVSQLSVYAQRTLPPGRLMSISNLLFDLGDKAALETRYQSLGMTEEEIRIALIALKQQEIVSANLPLYWQIPTVDGFDGGVLPTRYFTAFTALLLPPGALRTLDGRLRELLAREDCGGACVPDQRWLDLMQVRYLIMDKVYDIWDEGVAYDTGFRLTLDRGQQAAITVSPPFEADTLRLVCAGVTSCPVRAGFTAADGRQVTLTTAASRDIAAGRLIEMRIDDVIEPVTITLSAPDIPLTLSAATLVDSRTGSFQQLSFPPWMRVLSSDIKLYENTQVLARALVVHEALAVADDIYGTEAALALMRAPDFDPARTLILHGASAPSDAARPTQPAQAAIRIYQPEQVVIDVQTAAPGYLLLTDAYYPGWVAQVNGSPAPLWRADVQFRAVPVPAGVSEVVFEYRPAWLDGLVWEALAWGALIIVALLRLRPAAA
jgi:hypothetical protein